MLDFDVQRCTRRCSASQRELKAGELCYSALVPRGAQVVRLDFAPEAWKGPPENTLGWWKGRVPEGGGQKVAWAPNDVMLDYFDFLADKPEKTDVRYVLALLLVRRRVIRLESTRTGEDGIETLVVFCPKTEQESEVVAILPDDERVAEIQTELSTLLFGDASTLMPPRPEEDEPVAAPSIADETFPALAELPPADNEASATEEAAKDNSDSEISTSDTEAAISEDDDAAEDDDAEDDDDEDDDAEDDKGDKGDKKDTKSKRASQPKPTSKRRRRSDDN